MEKAKTILGGLFLFIGVGIISLKNYSLWGNVIGAVLIILGVIILFLKKEIDTQNLGYGWHGNDATDSED